MPKRKRNDGLPKTVCQHNNVEIRQNGITGLPHFFCTDCNQFVINGEVTLD